MAWRVSIHAVQNFGEAAKRLHGADQYRQAHPPMRPVIGIEREPDAHIDEMLRLVRSQSDGQYALAERYMLSLAAGLEFQVPFYRQVSLLRAASPRLTDRPEAEWRDALFDLRTMDQVDEIAKSLRANPDQVSRFVSEQARGWEVPAAAHILWTGGHFVVAEHSKIFGRVGEALHALYVGTNGPAVSDDSRPGIDNLRQMLQGAVAHIGAHTTLMRDLQISEARARLEIDALAAEGMTGPDGPIDQTRYVNPSVRARDEAKTGQLMLAAEVDHFRYLIGRLDAIVQ